jgi:hypothetical protein
MSKPITSQASKRILALDLLRGYFLCVIAIDHLYRFPSLLDAFTGQGHLWVSAAEGFFLISGLLVGLLHQSSQKIWRRAAKLYLWSIGLTLLFTWWGGLFDSHTVKSGIWLGGSPESLILNLVSLKYVYGWADFLPYYVIFLAFSPLALLALKQGKAWLVLLLSGLFWLVRGSNFYWAWQVLFFTGLVAGWYFNKLNYVLNKYKIYILLLALFTIILSAYYVFKRQLTLPLFDKTTLAPGRLVLSWLWFSAFYVLFRRFESIINRLTGGFLLLLGQNSLFVYGLQAVILFPLNSWLPSAPHFWWNTIYASGVILSLYLITAVKSRTPSFKPEGGIWKKLRPWSSG